jgi:hypothetical protein
MNNPAAKPDSLLATSGQTRKLHVAGLLFFGGLAITAFRHLPVFADGLLTTIAIATVGCLVAISGAMVALYGIRCPRCSLRWVWSALKTQSFTRWLFWLQEFNTCPKCGLFAGDGLVKRSDKTLERTVGK